MKGLPKESSIRELAKKFPELDTTALEVYLLLMRISSDIQLKMDQYFVKFNMTRGRFVPLVLLFTCPEKKMKPSALAEQTGVTRATMTGLLDSLEQCGLIKRAEHSVDRRATEVEITSAGERLLKKMLPPHFKRIASVMDGINERDRKSITSAFHKIRTNIETLEN